MELETIKVDAQGHVGYMILNRPDRLNALSATMMREIIEAADWLNRQGDLRVVMVHGAGNAFCAGADLEDTPVGEADPSSGLSWLERREVGQLGLRMAEAVERIRAVTIAQVHGYAVGGGLVLMTACDLRVVSENAVFSIPEIDLGIPLAWGGIPRLVREIGPAMTKELVMTCRPFTPAEAKVLGMVNRVVKPGKLVAEVEHLATILSRKPSAPLAITKEHVNSVARTMGAGDTSFADGDALLGIVQDPEFLKAAEAYRARRKGGGKG